MKPEPEIPFTKVDTPVSMKKAPGLDSMAKMDTPAPLNKLPTIDSMNENDPETNARANSQAGNQTLIGEALSEKEAAIGNVC